MILCLNLSIPAIAVLTAGRTEAVQAPAGFTLLTAKDGRLLTDGATAMALAERKSGGTTAS